MPLEHGSSHETISHNIAELMKAGHAQKQAVAIAYKEAGQAHDVKISGAGIMFTAPSGKALFLKRSDTGDHPGEWCFPGGGVEQDETPEDAARREAREETRPEMFLEAGPLTPMHRALSPEGVDFTTFRQPVVEEFTPTLNDEHTQFMWASPDDPPQPLHPGVKSVIAEDSKATKASVDYSLGKGDDRCMNCVHYTDHACELVEGDIDPEYWCELFKMRGAQDEKFAFDRATERQYDADGRLHIGTTNISKANICGYLGREVPGYQQLGLDPDRLYQFLRDPEELEKAAPTFNNLPLLSQHIPTTAEAFPNNLVIGSTGTDAAFVDPYLRNSLVIWKGDDIRDVENNIRKELSSAYRWRPDMTPGTYQGEPYDGVMRDIIGNHVALVKEGRAGPDVVVGDAAIIKLKELLMSKPVLSRKAAMVQGALAVYLRPRLAQDAKIDLTSLLTGLTDKTMPAKKAELVSGVTNLIKGKLAQDQNVDDLPKVMDELTDAQVAEGPDTDPNTGVPMSDEELRKKSMDADPVASIEQLLKGKVDDATLAAVMNCLRGGQASDKDPDDKDDDDDKVTKPAMDAAIDAAVKANTKQMQDNARALRDAENAVRPYVGDLAIACDSAEAVYRTALKTLGVEGIDAVNELPALQAILRTQQVPGTKRNTAPVAMDAAAVKSYSERFPSSSRIGNLGS